MMFSFVANVRKVCVMAYMPTPWAANTRTRAHTHTRIYTHICIHTHTHTHTYTHGNAKALLAPCDRCLPFLQTKSKIGNTVKLKGRITCNVILGFALVSADPSSTSKPAKALVLPEDADISFGANLSQLGNCNERRIVFVCQSSSQEALQVAFGRSVRYKPGL